MGWYPKCVYGDDGPWLFDCPYLEFIGRSMLNQASSSDSFVVNSKYNQLRLCGRCWQDTPVRLDSLDPVPLY